MQLLSGGGNAIKNQNAERMATLLDSGPPDPASPTGTVAFLLTDIEGSTQRWEAHREAMDNAVKRHDAILRDAVDRHNGYVFKAVSEAFCVASASRNVGARRAWMCWRRNLSAARGDERRAK